MLLPKDLVARLSFVRLFAKMKKKSVEKLSVAEARATLRSFKLRSTAARIAVLQNMANSSAPLSHAEVTEKLEDVGFDPSTIFRSLTELAEAGILHRVDLGDGARRFEFIREGEDVDGAHPHFLCLDCGKITCLQDFTFSLRSNKRSAQPGNVTEVLLKGHCTECA
jgi:Fur family transcriptional regulator, ferric uptake regulator